MKPLSKIVPVGAVILFAGLAFSQAPAVKKTDQPVADPVKTEPVKFDPIAGDERTLKDLGLPTNGAALLDYLRRQTFPEADLKTMESLVHGLGDDDFQVREASAAKLIQLGGKSVINGLKSAEKDNNFEVKRRAEDLRKKLEAKVEPAVQSATARLIARQRPDGSGEVLLAFLPFAADLAVVDEVCKALGAVTVTAKGVDPAIVAALEASNSLKRAAAGEAIARAKAVDYLPQARKLLQDPDPLVRARTGVALVSIQDSSSVSEALPALIECLKSLQPENLWAVEEILVRLAGDGKIPSTPLGNNETTREACFKAWRAWYDTNRNDIVLARLNETETMLGNTLIVVKFPALNRNAFVNNGVAMRHAGGGEVSELDMNKKVLWKIAIEDVNPVDAQVLPDRPNEVVIVESRRRRIAVRDIKSGKIVWEKEFAGDPIGVQALPGGKFLVTMSERIVEVDREKNAERTVVNRADHDIYRARATKNGDVVYVTNKGLLMRVDAQGKLLKQFQAPQIPILFGSIDVLANGNVLIPDYHQGRVVEYDANGNQVNQFKAAFPVGAMRLPNGNTLIASESPSRIVEINRGGNTVWSHTVEGQLCNARRR